MHERAIARFVLGALCCASLACNQAYPEVPLDDTSASGLGPTSGPEPDTNDPEGPDSGPGRTDPDPDPTVGSGETATTTADSGDDTDPPPLEGDYHPLVDGATWTYRHTGNGGVVWDEVVHMREVEYQGMTAYESEDNEDSNNESTIATLARDGDLVLRVHKDVSLAGVPFGSADYDPGFLRFDESWQEGDSYVWSYDRTEYDAGGAVVDQSPRDMIFTVEATSVEVTVPAGTFECVQVLRERIDNGDIKRYWFARGVGKVRHQSLSSGTTEELIEYSIP